MAGSGGAIARPATGGTPIPNTAGVLPERAIIEPMDVSAYDGLQAREYEDLQHSPAGSSARRVPTIGRALTDTVYDRQHAKFLAVCFGGLSHASAGASRSGGRGAAMSDVHYHQHLDIAFERVKDATQRLQRPLSDDERIEAALAEQFAWLRATVGTLPRVHFPPALSGDDLIWCLSFDSEADAILFKRRWCRPGSMIVRDG